MLKLNLPKPKQPARRRSTPDVRIANDIKVASHRSFWNYYCAARLLQGKAHEPFGTPSVETVSISYTRRIEREAGMSLAQIEEWAAGRMRRP